MILSFGNQAAVFLSAAAVGLALGLAYDVIRIIRLIIPHSRIVIHIEDAIYWTGAAFTAFLIMLKINNGEIRPYVLLGVILGMIIYFSVPSTLIMGAATAITDTIKKIFIIIIRPIAKAWRITVYPIMFLRNKLEKSTKKVLHLLMVYVKLNSKRSRRRLRALFKR